MYINILRFFSTLVILMLNINENLKYDPEKKYKSNQVTDLFDSIARTYDFLNHFLSGGIDFYWRWRALRLLKNPKPNCLLDVACGTADFSIAAARYGVETIYGIDIAEKMLMIGKNKIDSKGFSQRIKLEIGNAEEIRYESDFFDAAIVAFGVRNFENLEKGLSEMLRIIKPSGKILILEFSKPKHFPFKQIYFFYFKYILPLIGKIISKHNEAYNYLPNTVMNFPEGEMFLDILRKIGFKNTRQHRMTFRIATAYVGEK